MKALLTTADAATKLGVTARRVTALIAAGKLNAQKFGHVYMLRAADLAAVKIRKPGRPLKIESQRPA